jgi:NAD(P)-dependent dehydrogenase (short-subunit alcohol dehydrogenase family)
VTLAVTGARTSIVQGLLALVPDEEVVTLGRHEDDTVRLDLAAEFDVTAVPVDIERYVLASGLLIPKTLAQQDFEETARSIAVNLTSVVRICEHLLTNNPRARIAVVSSESSRGSFDTTYFLSKVALDAYIEGRRLSAPGQQLVAISPTIIMDSGMTQRRHDLGSVTERARRTPKGRLLQSDEVSRLLHYVLYVDEGTLTNTVIHLNCGEFAR